ncbi:MAG: transglycosylase domain-containing protein [Motilibacteraceae bacterium]
MGRLSAARRARSDRGSAASQLGLFVLVSALAGALVAALALPVLGSTGLAARAGAEGFQSLPADLATPPLPQSSTIVDAKGGVLARFYYENRIDVPLSKVAPIMRQAIVGIEDSRFYEHGGMDLRGTVRAVVNNSSGDSVQGGSTLTQQYVKLVLLEQATAKGNEDAAQEAVARSGVQGYARKLRELRYAIALEEKLTKPQILERYLNIAYFGSGAYGVEAASRHYFSVPAAKLSLPQAAMLAGIVNSPGAYDPTLHPQAAKDRRNVVLARMAELGYITPAQADQAAASPVKLTVSKAPNGCATSSAPYFCDYVVHSIENDPAFGQTPQDRVRLLLRGGLTIRTTLEPEVQQAAKQAVDANFPPKDPAGFATAVSMVKPGDGAIIAMAQDREWGEAAKGQRGITQINYNVDKPFGGGNGFQAGSTFKPFVMAAALQQGLPLNLRIYSPAKKRIGDVTTCSGAVLKDDYSPTNDSPYQSGSYTMATGMAESVNTYWLQVEQRIGVCGPWKVATSMGVTNSDGSPLPQLKSFGLGVAPVTPLTMAEAYATFAARGKHCVAYAITDVLDRAGKHLKPTRTPCQQVVDPAIADAVNQVLAGVIDGPDPRRTGAQLSLGRPAGGKTGTADDNKEVWFAGFTPEIAAAVWVGDPTGVKHLRDVVVNGRYISKGFGSTLAGPTWKAAMLAAVDKLDLPATPFQKPDPTVVRGQTTQVPDVAGLSASAASAKISDAGLAPQVMGKQVDSTQPAGSVAYTSPGAGSTISSGQTVLIYVSDGTPPPPPSPTPQPTQSAIPLPTAPPPAAGGGATPAPTPTKPGRGRKKP